MLKIRFPLIVLPAGAFVMWVCAGTVPSSLLGNHADPRMDPGVLLRTT